MQIFLFKDSKINRDFIRMNNYINRRKFTLDCTKKEVIDHLNIECAESKKNEFNKFKNDILSNIGKEREYGTSLGYGIDNMFNLELLGIEKNSKKYTILLDLSDSLDYILHILSGSSIETIRSIKDYSLISRCLLSNDLEDASNISFSALMGIDDNLDKYFLQLYDEMLTTQPSANISVSEEFETYILNFYRQILARVNSIKSYIMRCLRELDKEFLYKSKSFSASIGTSSIYPDTDIIIHFNDCDDYTLHLKIYERFEYLKEFTE